MKPKEQIWQRKAPEMEHHALSPPSGGIGGEGVAGSGAGFSMLVLVTVEVDRCPLDFSSKPVNVFVDIFTRKNNNDVGIERNSRGNKSSRKENVHRFKCS